MTPTLKDPIDWPVVRMGGEVVPLEYNYRVLYRAGKQGLDLRKANDPIAGFATIMDVFAIIAAPIAERRGDKPRTGDEWAVMVEGPEHLREISDAINRAYQLSLKSQPAVAAPSSQTPAPGTRPS